MTGIEYAIFMVAIAGAAFGVGSMVGGFKAYDAGKKDGFEAGLMVGKILNKGKEEA